MNNKDDILEYFENVDAAKGTNAKKVLLKEYILNLYFATLLDFTFNPYISFHVVKVPKTKKENRKPNEPREAWKTFILNADRCSKREVTGNAAIELMKDTFNQSSEAQEKWMRKVLKKNLAIGVSVKSLNKVQSNFIPTFDVALAQKFDMKRIKGSSVYVEPKLDGIRCLAVVENGKAKIFTRAGKLITNFDVTLGRELSQLGDGCYDGEIMSNDFTDLMRQVYRKKNVDTSDVYLGLFDYIPLQEWRSNQGKLSCKKRFTILSERLRACDLDYLRLVTRAVCEADYNLIKEYHDKFVDVGYEGAMIKDITAPYCFGRDWSVMKFKAFFDADVPITALLEGTGKHSGKLGSFVVDYKGVEVRVGSGLTDDLREQIWSDKSAHVGRTIEVRYQEETPDGSLRFPTFVCFRNDK
jgi:DNA ligase-1